MKLEYKVTTNNYKTINQILVNEFNISTRLLNKLIRNKRIYKNNILADTREFVKINDLISVDFNYAEDNSNIIPTKMDLSILYEDEWLLILNKPANIAIHPSVAHYESSLSNGIKYYFDNINLKKKIRPVNRLDKNTSGIVVFAKCEYIQEHLIRQMQSNEFKKQYLCVVDGFLSEKQGTINLPIARKDNSIIERCVNPNGQTSITDYIVIQEFKSYSLVKCLLRTGRTHQIRVHFSYIGHSLIGDTLYGKPSSLINRQALHSYKLEFIHPVTKELMSFTADLPKNFKNLIR